MALDNKAMFTTNVRVSGKFWRLRLPDLTLNEGLELHQQIIERSGGLGGIRDLGAFIICLAYKDQ